MTDVPVLIQLDCRLDLQLLNAALCPRAANTVFKCTLGLFRAKEKHGLMTLLRPYLQVLIGSEKLADYFLADCFYITAA